LNLLFFLNRVSISRSDQQISQFTLTGRAPSTQAGEHSMAYSSGSLACQPILAKRKRAESKSIGAFSKQTGKDLT
jgi:hypothetical protein